MNKSQEEPEVTKRKSSTGKSVLNQTEPIRMDTSIIDDQQSEITIYQNVVKNAINKRSSSSSEEEMDTSDETINNNLDQNKTDNHTIIEQFIVEQRRHADQTGEREWGHQGDSRM